MAKIDFPMFGLFLSLLFVFQYAYCAGALPHETLETEISACKYVTMVEGDSGQNQLKNWQQVAKTAALKQAAKLNASDVVWDKVIALKPNSGIVLGKAYRCNKP